MTGRPNACTPSPRLQAFWVKDWAFGSQQMQNAIFAARNAVVRLIMFCTVSDDPDPLTRSGFPIKQCQEVRPCCYVVARTCVCADTVTGNSRLGSRDHRASTAPSSVAKTRPCSIASGSAAHVWSACELGLEAPPPAASTARNVCPPPPTPGYGLVPNPLQPPLPPCGCVTQGAA